VKNNQTAVRDTLAFKYCPGAPDHAFCACYNAEIPPSWVGDPVKEAIFRCLDPKCQAPQALKPHEFTCPTSYTDCRIRETEFNALESDVRVNMENQCGNIIFEDDVEEPPPPFPDENGDGNGGTTPPPPPPAPKTSKVVIIIAVVILVLLILAAIGVFAATRKKKGAPSASSASSAAKPKTNGTGGAKSSLR
jgi:hypothetical protein